MRVFVWLAHKNEHLSLNVGNVLERKTCMNNKKLMDSSTDGGGVCPRFEVRGRRSEKIHLRGFVFICGCFWAWGGLRRRKTARNGLGRAEKEDFDRPDLSMRVGRRKWTRMRSGNGGVLQEGLSSCWRSSGGSRSQSSGWASTSRATSPRSLRRLLCRRRGSRQAAILPAKVSSREATRIRMP